ncbi:transmembrane 7 superfamily member 3-like isoform X1 [Erpetoichthys calabaricus]|uniref:transmembrane 7 superfamily member 3-like isoform X1 n=1 Tax=Erpetoichthys calabaricus TaxID=27687 RepID=UPI0022349728|nr:transmembrane 7 superfamily member 3-like isoform X1 [Erpetoichthys calabaricus]
MALRMQVVYLLLLFACHGKWISCTAELQYVVPERAENILAVHLFKPTVIQLLSNRTVHVLVNVNDSSVVGLIAQVQAQFEEVTISQFQKFNLDSSYTGQSAGLVIPLNPGAVKADFYLTCSQNVSAYVTVVSYGEKDPVPGSCNLEFSLENDPNLHLKFGAYETIVKFAPANLGVARGKLPPACDVSLGTNSRWRLKYTLYLHFLPANDMSEEILFSGIEKMTSATEVEKYGNKLLDLNSGDKTQLFVNSYAAFAVIHNIIVWDPLLNTSFAYVPSFIYTCNMSTTLPPVCEKYVHLSTQIFFTILGIFGLLVCFSGHRFLEAEFLFIGFILFAFISFVLMRRYTDISFDMCLILTAVVGIFGGTLLALSHWQFGLPFLLIFIVGFVMGLLVASIVYFSPVLVNQKVFQSDLMYWVCFISIVLIVPVFLLISAKMFNIICCALIGAYSFVCLVGTYFPTSVSYIFVNVIRRAVHPDFFHVITPFPLQLNDYVLIGVWTALATGGVLSQTYITRNQPYFPGCPYESCRKRRSDATNDERAPLLGSRDNTALNS